MYEKIDGFLLKKQEKKFIKYILPYSYFLKNKNDVHNEYVLNLLQTELNGVLNSFLNGGYSKAGYVLHPALNSVSKSNVNKLGRVRIIAQHLNKNGLDFSKSLKTKLNSKQEDFAKCISELYKDLSSLGKTGKKSQTKKKLRNFRTSYYKENYVKKNLTALKKDVDSKISKHCLGYYLHGSFGTLDYFPGYSDVDTFAIVKKESIGDWKKLVSLRRTLFASRKHFIKIDPLQHHGTLLIAEQDISSYCQAYFPVKVMEYSVSMFEDKKIKFKIRSSNIESVSKLFWFVDYFRKVKNKKNMGWYDYKFLLHAIALFPTLYLQAKGKHVYKKYSFGLAKKKFTKKMWEPVDMMTNIRKNWSMPKTTVALDMGLLNPVLRNQINSKVWDVSSRKKIGDIGELTSKMFKLSEYAWNDVLKGLKKDG